MTEKHIAIFKGEIKEIQWSIYDNISYLESHQNELKRYLRYGYKTHREEIELHAKLANNFERKIKVIQKSELLKYDEIWSGEIPKPVLDLWEDIWINDLELLVKVVNKYRTTDGEVIYETRHIIDTLITENSEKSRLEAIDKWFETAYPNLQAFEQLNVDAKEDVVEQLDSEPEPMPTWEVNEEPKKEKTWFGWLFNK